jgi:hypothetical protein
MLYFAFTRGAPDIAITAGMMGVMCGFLPFVGMQFAKLLWKASDDPRSGLSAPFLAVCFVVLVGLLAIMRLTGEFGERVYGSFVPLWEFGAVLGTPFGLVMAVALWHAERESVGSPKKP